MRVRDPLRRFSPWFYAAAAYNAAWGGVTALVPTRLGFAWQVVGLLVLAYAPAYWSVARRPSERAHLIAIALVGKVLGPIGFVCALALGKLPLAFGVTVVTNDLIWLPAFVLYLRAAARSPVSSAT
jgi:hypothetical protein